VREVKKSKKREDAHLAQLKFYLFVLERNGIDVSHGILEYPRLRETEEVYLTETDRQIIPHWEAEAQRIIQQPDCPALVKKTICKKCAYYEWCFVDAMIL
jgi:CRISPR-associated exonuclease Cas4